MTSAKRKLSAPSLFIGSLGVVFGDIGTSPLYAFRETLKSGHFGQLSNEHILSILSLIFWTIIIIVSIKYVIVIMRAENHGEGGSLALLALVNEITKKSQVVNWTAMLGLCGAAFFFGDCMLTPAISVLSAIEGVKIVAPHLDAYVIPLTLIVLSGLFWIQQYGTAMVGKLFGPVMTVWFLALAILGVMHIAEAPSVLNSLNPYYAFSFVANNPFKSFFVLGTVFLAVTGGEALYADMGHFGRQPIRLAWFTLVLPALVLNYFGQGALLFIRPEAIENPFYLLAPPMFQLPLVILATMATIIASQSVISGAFSMFRQAVQLDYLPRISIVHTSGWSEGQIYMPFVNWTLYVAVVGLVLAFQTSSHLAAAYGIAVSGTMITTTLLVTVVMRLNWNWSYGLIALVALPLFFIDLIFVLANALKIPHGGWFSLVIGIVSLIFLTTWKQGRRLVHAEIKKHSLPLTQFVSALDDNLIRVPGNAVVMTGELHGVPSALKLSVKHHQVLHEQVVILTVITEDVPTVDKRNRLELTSFEGGFYRLLVRYGFMQSPNIPQALAQCADLGLELDLMETSFLLSSSIIIPTNRKKMARWRKHLFAMMARNSTNAADFFHIPSNRVLELGMRLEI